ncbi:uncharacterized protein N7498_000721 [Penicillium cinerascens]|uniref:pyridoxal 5'-phosphate synthase n=1 Tax=Penicillium cinerascens TaxID=70096 RepID=A0A9W9NEW0_9EURO|nr:uncharacterized protein N7498_000721 [Penicillium cinerascens]KAJ5218622.1 hypothetical protein N7498_000721 [Penicillium cinerascens]
MLSRLSTPIAFDLFLRIGITASRQPRSRHLHSSTPRLVHNSNMSQNVEAGAQSRRPKKLIFAPGDIEAISDSPEPPAHAQSAVPSHLGPEALRSQTSTPNSTSESQLMSHPARAHQFVTNPPLTISQMHGTNPLHQFNTWFHDPRLTPSSSPETCTLATAELPSGRVSARVLYLKELDEHGWVVYSNWGSREGKGRQVWGPDANTDTIGSIPPPGDLPQQGNKWGALTFLWASVERQVRIEGMLEPLSREESEPYWRTRERGSQIGAWASWQSRVLWSGEPLQLAENQRRKSVAKLQGNVPADIDETDINDGRALLEERVKDMEQRFAGVENIPLPPFWGGVRLVPESVEFWQGRKSRLHDRFRYVRVEGSGVGGDAQWRVQRLSP